MVLGSVFLRPVVLISGQTQYFVRVMFWGNDDTGIEQDQYFETIEEALGAYDRLVKWLTNLAIVCRQDLVNLGFKYA